MLSVVEDYALYYIGYVFACVGDLLKQLKDLLNQGYDDVASQLSTLSNYTDDMGNARLALNQL